MNAYLRKIVAVLVACMILTGVPATALAQDSSAPDTVLNKGDIAVTEIVDHANKSIVIFGGELEAEFTVTEAEGVPVPHNAWTGYPSVEDAQMAACQLASEREGFTGQGSWAEGYSITFNGEPFTGECDLVDLTGATPDADANTDDSSTSGSFTLPSREVEVSDELRLGDTVKEVGRTAENVTFPAGSILIVRITDASQMVIYVDVVVLDEETTIEVGPGMRATHVWYNYQDELHASRDACREADARFLESITEGNWNYQYLVYLNGDQLTVPSNCG